VYPELVTAAGAPARDVDGLRIHLGDLLEEGPDQARAPVCSTVAGWLSRPAALSQLISSGFAGVAQCFLHDAVHRQKDATKVPIQTKYTTQTHSHR